MSGHTPGPWEIRTVKQGYPYQIVAPNGTHVRNVTRWAALSVPALPEGQANARLIAAAPDLLAACKLALESGEFLCGEDGIVKAAIAKAEGR